MTYGNNYWGPKAWYLLHSFSIYDNSDIKKNERHKFYIFYTTFIYIIPCFKCSQHYTNILYHINPLDEKKINREYIKKWVFDTHNIVNGLLDKNDFPYSDLDTLYNKIDNELLFYTLKILLLNIDYKNISCMTFDQVYNFFINFCKLYPDKIIRKNLKTVIKTNHFLKIETPFQFHKWLKDFFFY
jgi:hypothetical protein